GHVDGIFDAADLLFDRCGDGIEDSLGVGAGVTGGDEDGWRRDIGILCDRQTGDGDAAGQGDHDRQHGREDGAINEEMGDHDFTSIIPPLPRGERGDLRFIIRESTTNNPRVSTVNNTYSIRPSQYAARD